MSFNNFVSKNNNCQVRKNPIPKYYSLKRSEPNLLPDQPNYKTEKSQYSEVKGFFTKKFQFKKKSNWKLPHVNDIFKATTRNRTVDQLQCIKYELNGTKNKLNDIPLDVWSKFTGKRDPSSAIAWFIRKEINAEFVTKAWCKFYECLSSYPIVQVDNNGQFNSVHLCEAPGMTIV